MWKDLMLFPAIVFRKFKKQLKKPNFISRSKMHRQDVEKNALEGSCRKAFENISIKMQLQIKL